MKTIKYLFLSVLFITAFSCEVETEDNVTNEYEVGGLLEVPATSQLISYVLGSGATYTANFTVPISQNPTVSVDIYKKYVGADGSLSNEELMTTVDVGGYGNYSFSFTYEDLISGLTVDGVPLPASDSGLAIADAWVLTYKSKVADGNVYTAPASSKVAVGTRLAGIYLITFSEYHHWTGDIYSFVDAGGGEWTRTIESIALTTDYTIYRYSNVLFDYWADDHSFFYFYVYNEPIEVDGNDYRIEIPKEYEGEAQYLFVDELELATCTDLDIYDPPAPPFPYDCDDNFVTLMEDGHDVIHILYGYITSGIRPGYEEDTKQF